MPSVDDWAPPGELAKHRAMVRRPEFARASICTMCAVWLGAQWQPGNSQKFIAGECPCCGCTGPVTLVSSWLWGPE